MKPFSDIEKLPIAGLTAAILWFLCIPCHNTLLDVLIYNVGGVLFIVIPLVYLVYKHRRVKC